jgi:ATP-dependent Clp protease ATP-binding subunit ClpC
MEKLSPHVDKVIKRANQIARDYEQEYIGTEHILLAIMREDAGLGARILQRKGIDEAELKTEIDKHIKASMEDTWVFGRLPGTPHLKNVIAKAIEEARQLNNKNICTEHLLLGLMGEKGCVAQMALKHFGLTPKQVRQQIVTRQGSSKEVQE